MPNITLRIDPDLAILILSLREILHMKRSDDDIKQRRGVTLENNLTYAYTHAPYNILLAQNNVYAALIEYDEEIGAPVFCTNQCHRIFGKQTDTYWIELKLYIDHSDLKNITDRLIYIKSRTKKKYHNDIDKAIKTQEICDKYKEIQDIRVGFIPVAATTFIPYIMRYKSNIFRWLRIFRW